MTETYTAEDVVWATMILANEEKNTPDDVQEAKNIRYWYEKHGNGWLETN